MVFGDIHREEAPAVGEPADATVQELAGIAPPCECGAEATHQIDGTDYCDECADDIKHSGERDE